METWMNEAEQLLSWFTGFNTADLEEILERLSVEQRTQLQSFLGQERATEIDTLDAAVRVSEGVLEIVGDQARQLGFATPDPFPAEVIQRLTDNPPKDQTMFPQNRRVRFANVVDKLKKLLDRWESKKNESKP
jgi:hypothetical protein